MQMNAVIIANLYCILQYAWYCYKDFIYINLLYPPTTLWEKIALSSHFTNNETEAQECELAPGHTAGKWQCWLVPQSSDLTRI